MLRIKMGRGGKKDITWGAEWKREKRESGKNEEKWDRERGDLRKTGRMGQEKNKKTGRGVTWARRREGSTTHKQRIEFGQRII